MTPPMPWEACFCASLVGHSLGAARVCLGLSSKVEEEEEFEEEFSKRLSLTPRSRSSRPPGWKSARTSSLKDARMALKKVGGSANLPFRCSPEDLECQHSSVVVPGLGALGLDLLAGG